MNLKLVKFKTNTPLDFNIKIREINLEILCQGKINTGQIQDC